jgi:hypothetical protein
MKLRITLLALLCSATHVAAAADPDLASIYSRLLFEVCVPEVTRQTNAVDGKKVFPGFVVGRAQDVGSLASFLQLQSTDKYYLVATADASVANNVRAFVEVTGKSCGVVARNLPGIQDSALAAMNDSSGSWHLQFKKGIVRMDVGLVGDTKVELMTRVSSGEANDTVYTLIKQTDVLIPDRISAENMNRWVKTMTDVCVNAGLSKRPVADTDVAEFFERTPAGDKTNLSGKIGFPAGLLFTHEVNSNPCQFMGTAGYGDTQQLLEALQAELAARGAVATNKPTKIKSDKLMLPKAIDAKRSAPQISVSYSTLIDGAAAVIGFWVN